MRNEIENLDDDQLYEDYEAYKALVEAGVPKKDALKKTGLTPQIVRDIEEEMEEEDDYKSEFKEVWDSDDDYDDDGPWQEEELESDWDDDGNEDYDEIDKDY